MTQRIFFTGLGYILMFLAGMAGGVWACTKSQEALVWFLVLLILGNICGLISIKSRSE